MCLEYMFTTYDSELDGIMSHTNTKPNPNPNRNPN